MNFKQSINTETFNISSDDFDKLLGDFKDNIIKINILSLKSY
ncbi:MAG: hypothetical protein ACRDD7_01180 [Peptostreptococcaceae bacterium]